MIIDLARWYTRCLRQLGIDEKSDSEVREEVEHAICLFVENPRWLKHVMLHSGWVEVKGHEASLESQAQDKTTNSVNQSIEEFINNAGDGYSPSPKLISYGEPLPIWFLDFFDFISTDAGRVIFWGLGQFEFYVSHYVQGVTLSTCSEHTDEEIRIALGLGKNSSEGIRSILTWIIGVLRNETTRRISANELYRLLGSEVKGNGVPGLLPAGDEFKNGFTWERTEDTQPSERIPMTTRTFGNYVTKTRSLLKARGLTD